MSAGAEPPCSDVPDVDRPIAFLKPTILADGAVRADSETPARQGRRIGTQVGPEHLQYDERLRAGVDVLELLDGAVMHDEQLVAVMTLADDIHSADRADAAPDEETEDPVLP